MSTKNRLPASIFILDGLYSSFSNPHIHKLSIHVIIVLLSPGRPTSYAHVIPSLTCLKELADTLRLLPSRVLGTCMAGTEFKSDLGLAL